jgi:hypothetical protein
VVAPIGICPNVNAIECSISRGVADGKVPEAPKKDILPLLGLKDRVLRVFGISAYTLVLFGGEALSPGGR